MSAYELSAMLNISVTEAQNLIEHCDSFDRYMESLYDLEAGERFDYALSDLIENAAWDFNWDDYADD